MKLFKINETEWIAANSLEEAIEFAGLEPEDVTSQSEIPESEWDEEIEVYYREDVENGDMPDAIQTTLISRMATAIESGKPMKIMSEE